MKTQNTTKVMDSAKAAPRETFADMNPYVKEEERARINNLNRHLMEL